MSFGSALVSTTLLGGIAVGFVLAATIGPDAISDFKAFSKEADKGQTEWDATCTFNGAAVHGTTSYYGDINPSRGPTTVEIKLADGKKAALPVNFCAFNRKPG